MKQRWLLLFYISIAPFTHIIGQNFAPQSWLKHIADERPIATLSLPGAHDAATGQGVFAPPGLGVTQSLSIAELWDCGIRVFDLRPALNKNSLHIYHGILKTRKSFHAAIETICSKLAQNPSEFAIVLLREESETENEEERRLWPHHIGCFIENLGNKAAHFSKDLILRDVRGKILFLTRTPYTGTTKGGYIKGWNHTDSGNNNAQIIACDNSSKARLQVQDYYAPTNKDKRTAKLLCATRYLNLAQSAPSDVWTINFISGYATTWLQTGHFATSSGYKRHAAYIHPAILKALTSSPSPSSCGIVVMDYAGADSANGGILHWQRFKTLGRQIVNAIIQKNF